MGIKREASGRQPLSLGSRLMLGTAFATSAFVGGYRGYVRRAHADCNPLGGGTYLCSGPTTTTQTLAPWPPVAVIVTTDNTFSINAPYNAFFLRSSGGLTFTDNNQSAITGSYRGFDAANLYSGGLSITTTGSVRGGSFGIEATNHTETTDLTITAADVSGRIAGIIALNRGTGELSITATGRVAGEVGLNNSGNGIRAENQGSDLTIRAVDVRGRANGIRALNEGDGRLSIIATGAVTGAVYDGIFAHNYGTDLEIVAADVSGGFHGIVAHNDGIGALTITTNGTAIGTNLEGIYAGNAGTHLTINAMGDVAGQSGIFARNYGGGNLSITATGAVTGTQYSGIYASNSDQGEDLTIRALGNVVGQSGIFARNYGNGELSITATGAVTGTVYSGIYASNSDQGTNLTIVAADARGERGISARNEGSGALSITTTGTVTGTKFDGIVARNGAGPTSLTNAGTIQASKGIFAETAGPVTITNTGSILGTDGIAIDLTAADGPNTVNQQGGTIDGDILMSPTSDVLNIAGGKINGNFIAALTTNHSGGVIAPGHSIGTLTIDGDYVGEGGILEIEAELGGDASPADKLVVTGDTSGGSNVRVLNVGGTGAQTVNGIKVVDVGGNSAGTFTLLGDFMFQDQPAVVAGAYAYVLEQNGISTPTDGDWYLRSALFAPSTAIYEAYPGVLQNFNQPSMLQQRLGNRSWTIEAQGADAISEEMQAVQGIGIWGKIEGTQGSFEPDTSTSGTTYDISLLKLEAGFDMPLYEHEAGNLVGGLAVHYGRISSDVTSPDSEGSIDTTGYGLTGTLTWYGNSGFYVDGQARLTGFDSDIYSDTLSTSLVSGNDGLGYALSVETGQRIPVAPRWSLTPQAQLVYAAVDFDDFTDPFGATVSLENGDSLLGRLGLSADYEDEWQNAAQQTSRTHLYGIANLYYDFLAESKVDVSGVNFISEDQSLWGGVGVGGTLSWANGKYSLYGEGLARSSFEDFGDSYLISGNIGFSLNW